ncbi:polysaccharide biosynthesis protein [Brevibacillus sp. SYP-B805]|uniref:putative polysaccharide biosynthesis protein n=1 Tax=Brevibacillus sp. SYP-B805 TaxID=1578199 RepID=UPI0013ED93FA|nr:polysaccharide biosynthesis protein [Brevibacillus sp. SYP-B805]NGQ93606.1 polysaccharide biosynthesis protein [Brevibacillus sp. SYP-B805]
MTRDSLVKGTVILSVASFITRFLGVIQRVPLIYLLGTEALGSYGIANNLYTTLLVIGTAGMPSALSKMISEKTSLGQFDEANRIFRAAISFAIGIGIMMSALLYVIAPYYAAISGDPHATLATKAIAPALLIFPLISIMRGYFQGRQHMLPVAITQIMEQFVRLVTSLSLAYLLIGMGKEWGAAGASLGGVAGGLAALTVLIYHVIKLQKKDKKQNRKLAGDPSTTVDNPAATIMTYKDIYASLLKLSIPIVIFSMTVSLIYTIDSSTIIPLLKGHFRTSQAKEILGILVGIAQPIAGLPIILAIALSQSIVPIVSSAHSRHDTEEVKKQTSKVLQLSVLSGLPMVLAICIGARPLAGILNYGGTDLGHVFGPNMIIFVTASSLFQIMMQTSGAVLMGMGKMRVLMFSVAMGIATKVCGNYLLSPLYGIYGILSATLLCFIVMMNINLHFLRKEVCFQILPVRRWIGLIVSTVTIILLGTCLEMLTRTYNHVFKWDVFIQVTNAIMVCGFVLLLYPMMLILTKVVTRDQFENLPAPLQRILPIKNKRMHDQSS